MEVVLAQGVLLHALLSQAGILVRPLSLQLPFTVMSILIYTEETHCRVHHYIGYASATYSGMCV